MGVGTNATDAAVAAISGNVASTYRLRRQARWLIVDLRLYILCRRRVILRTRAFRRRIFLPLQLLLLLLLPPLHLLLPLLQLPQGPVVILGVATDLRLDLDGALHGDGGK